MVLASYSRVYYHSLNLFMRVDWYSRHIPRKWTPTEVPLRPILNATYHQQSGISRWRPGRKTWRRASCLAAVLLHKLACSCLASFFTFKCCSRWRYILRVPARAIEASRFLRGSSTSSSSKRRKRSTWRLVDGKWRDPRYCVFFFFFFFFFLGSLTFSVSSDLASSSKGPQCHFIRGS